VEYGIVRRVDLIDAIPDGWREIAKIPLAGFEEGLPPRVGWLRVLVRVAIRVTVAVGVPIPIARIIARIGTELLSVRVSVT